MPLYANAVRIKSGGVVVTINADIDGSPSSIPLDPKNADYQAIQQLVKAGDLVLTDFVRPAEPDDPRPAKVAAAQAKVAAMTSGPTKTALTAILDAL